MNWTATVKIHNAQHEARLEEMRARRDVNAFLYGTEYPWIARDLPSTYQVLMTAEWKPEPPIIPARISARHPFAH